MLCSKPGFLTSSLLHSAGKLSGPGQDWGPELKFLFFTVTANIPRFWRILLLGGTLSHQSHRSPHRPYEESDCSLSAHEVQRERQQRSQSYSATQRVFGQRVDGAERKVPTGSPELLLLVSHLSPSGRRVLLSSCQFAESKFVASGEAFEEVPVAFQGPLVCWERPAPPSA